MPRHFGIPQREPRHDPQVNFLAGTLTAAIVLVIIVAARVVLG